MLQLLRAFLSVFVAIEMFITGLAARGKPSADVPDGGAAGLSAYVDPLIGTGGIPWTCGMLSPAAAVPFGCVRVGPDTSAVNGGVKIKTNTSGYYYEHRHILGFSMSRLSGTGARDYQMFRVTPAAGPACSAKPGPLAYAHENETALPGYYAVYLPGAASLCEMTAASHAALQRYTFRGDAEAGLYIDASSGAGEDGARDAFIRVDPAANSLTAYCLLTGAFSDRYGGLPVYLHAEWDLPVTGVTAHTSAGDTEGTEAAGDGAGVLLRFGSRKNESVTLRMGVSFLSAENARENLAAELGGADFDTARQMAAQAWESRLSAVRINADENTKKIFYTALYHAMLMPSDFTEADGRYLGFDGEAHTAEGFTYRTDISLWDTCRCVHSLYTLIAPDVQADCLQSLLLMAEQGGSLPRWPMGAGRTNSMFGNPANIVFTESYLKGLPFDAEKAYGYMKQASESPQSREGAAEYLAYGYLPYDLTEKQSVSKTLEYAWEDAATAVLAEALGHADEAAVYRQRAANYRSLWDAQTKYFRPKNSDGSWGPLYPKQTSFYDEVFGTKFAAAYCEGGAQHWRWSVQQDIPGLIELFGGSEAFVKELESFMEGASLTRAAIDPGAGYWIGNQHDIHTPYLFNDAGRPDLTQKWVRWTLKNRFSTDVNGLDGNDDGGTLSSWYIFSALGFYPVAGTDRYWIGSPNVRGAELTLPGGKTLKVTVNNQSEENVYVAAVTFNGEPLARPYLTHEALAAGGELAFEMSARPASR